MHSARDSEVERAITEGVNSVGDAIPENNYWAFAAYTMIVPQILKELKYKALPQSTVSGPLWNYLDSACSIFVGINQLRDNESHRPNATKIKGVVNILNGVQLIALTKISFVAFGGPGFAAAFGVGFAISLDDTARAVRRMQDDEYWFTDTLAELEKIEAMLQTKELENEIKALERAMSSDQPRGGAWALKRKKERLAALEERRHELREDLMTRMVTMRSSDTADSHPKSDFIQREISAVIARDESPTEFKAWINSTALPLGREPLDKIKETARTKLHQAKEQKIQEKNRNLVTATVRSSVIWGIAFVGMLLSCIPGFQIPGLIVVGIAAGLYFGKNAYSLGSSFFGNTSDTKADTLTTEKTSDPPKPAVKP